MGTFSRRFVLAVGGDVGWAPRSTSVPGLCPCFCFPSIVLGHFIHGPPSSFSFLFLYLHEFYFYMKKVQISLEINKCMEYMINLKMVINSLYETMVEKPK